MRSNMAQRALTNVSLLLMTFSIAVSQTQLTRIDYPGAYPEADFYKKDGILYANAILVNFKENVIPTQRGVSRIEKGAIDTKYGSVLLLVNQIEKDHGKVSFIKQVPDAIWGDVVRVNRRTGKKVTVPDLSQIFRVEFDEPVNLNQMVARFESLSAVESVQKPGIMVPCVSPNDPEYQSNGGQWNLDAVNAQKAWDVTKGSASTKVAFIEHDGTDLTHEDLQGKIVGGNGATGGNLTHGTEVAGIIGAVTDNSLDVASLGWNLSLLAYSTGDGANNTINAIYQAAADGADVINMSWQWLDSATIEDILEHHPECQDPERWVGCYAPKVRSSIDNAIVQYAVQQGIVCVAAIGNESKNQSSVDPSCDPMSIPYICSPFTADGVIVVSGTRLNGTSEEFRDGWNHNSYVTVASPGEYIKSTIPGGVDTDGGTSFATPLVSALVGLILSYNPSLTIQQVRDILINNTDKIGGDPYVNGWNEYLGYGRINAHKALLAAAAYSNKTYTYWGGYNGARILLKDGSGFLHNVVNSGGEIVYRKSTDGGTSWGNVRVLSADNGANEAPSLALLPSGGSTYLQAVWQRKLSNDYYELWYSKSTDGGGMWTDPDILPGASSIQVSYSQSNASGAPGPTPVVTAMNGSNTKLLCVWAQYNGLKYKTTNDLNSWSGTISSVPSSVNGDPWCPSLSTYGLSPQKAYLIYSERYIGMWSQSFDANNGTWSSRISAGSGAYERYPSMALYGDGMNAVWSRWNGSQYVIRYRSGSYNSWSGYVSDFTVSSLNSFFPAITFYTDYYSQRKMTSVWHTSDWSVYQRITYPEGGWINYNYLLSSNACYPNITSDWEGSGTPKMTWTNLGSSPYPPPYTSILSSQNLPKNANVDRAIATRGIEMNDKTSGATYSITLKGLPFKKVDPTTVGKLDLNSALELLETETFSPNAGQKMSLEIETSVFEPDTLASGELRTSSRRVTQNLSVVFDVTSDDMTIGEYAVYAGQLSQTKVDRTFDLSDFSATTIRLKPRFTTSIKDTPDVEYLVVEGSGAVNFESPEAVTPINVIPSGFSISSYPNPSNPTSKIQVNIPRKGMVSVKIYDMLGREIVDLHDGYLRAGYYSFIFDGSHLTSGTYFCRTIFEGHVTTQKLLLVK